jgi:fatty-acyl-CoA synthase
MTLTPQQVREHCTALLAPYEVPEYVVFAQALPTNAAGKTLKPPLVDFWGDGLDGAAARLGACCAGMPETLLDKPQFKLDGDALTPRAALQAVQTGSALGGRISEVVGALGIAALLQPDEARFRQA